MQPWQNLQPNLFRGSNLHTLSVVIPSYSRPDLLARCLSSLRRNAPLSTEIIVVDDASENKCISEVAAKFKGVKVIRTPKRLGFCKAANLGVQAAIHDVVELLNDDTEVCAGWAEMALDTFEDPKVAAVAPLVLRWPGQIEGRAVIDSAGDAYFASGVATKRGNGQIIEEKWMVPGPVFGASGSSAFYRREVFLKVGAYPESFGAYFEDVDLSFRLHWAGYDVVFQPCSKVLHRVSSSYGNPGLNRKLLERQSLNEERVYWRNIPCQLLWRTLPLHLLTLLAKAWRRGTEGTLLPFLMGKLSFIREIPAIFAHRKKLQKDNPMADHQRWCLESLGGLDGFLPRQLARF
ncbi:MAG: glycosyltransferase family 2 protein [Planctomycetes bacterium]|nr:glycosyltransferase family 2 protein [Planctomycetota bacterium]